MPDLDQKDRERAARIADARSRRTYAPRWAKISAIARSWSFCDPWLRTESLARSHNHAENAHIISLEPRTHNARLLV